MSCWGSRTTQIVEFKLDHVISYDDMGVRTWGAAFHTKINLFVRVWKWELDATFLPRRGRGWARSGWHWISTPLGTLDWSFDDFPVHQYSGDYNERYDDPEDTLFRGNS